MAWVTTDEAKKAVKKYENLLKEIKDLIRSINNNPDDSGEKYMKIKLNSDGNLPLKKILELFK